MKARKKPCMDCNIDTVKNNEHYFIHQYIWNSICNTISGFLCIKCLEIRLKRQLTSSDFPNVYINRIKYAQKSQLLINRLQA